MENKIIYCDMCERDVVVCGKCGMNCCSGGYGEVDGITCDNCASAYKEDEDMLNQELLINAIVTELRSARTKFPGKNVTFAALVEEVGELSTALFSEPAARVRAEAVQVAVMAMRIVLDGDHTFDAWREDKLLDALTRIEEER